MYTYKSYKERIEEVNEKYNYPCYKDWEEERVDKLNEALEVIDNTRLTRAEWMHETEEAKKLYAKGKYKAEGQAEYEQALKEVKDAFFTELRQQFGDVVDSVYNKCLSHAWDKGHSCGYDEVADYLEEEIDYLKELEELLGIKIISK